MTERVIVEAGTGWHGDNYRVLVHDRRGPYAQLAWWPVAHYPTLREAQKHRNAVAREEGWPNTIQDPTAYPELVQRLAYDATVARD